MPQGLNDFKDNRIPERGIGWIKVALAHHPFSQLSRIQLPIRLQMTDADIRDLALLEESVADNVAGAIALAALEQTDRRIHMRKVVPRLGNPSLIRCNDAADLGTLLF